MTYIKDHVIRCFESDAFKFKSSAGYPIEIDYNNCTEDTIVGAVIFDGNHMMPVEWNNDGVPLRLPLHQGLNLVPLRRIYSYEVIPVEDRI